MNFPDNLKYTKEHEWVRIEGNTAIIGITDFAQSKLGDIVYVEIETAGETLDKDSIFGTVEAVKTLSELFMPVSGKVIAINDGLVKAPEYVNTDPYDKGWMIRVEMTNPSDVGSLLSAVEYEQLVGADA